MDDELDLGLEIPAPPVQHQPANVVWIAYKPKNPVHCDVCLAIVHAMWPDNTHAPNRAVFRRRSTTEPDMYYCSIHADPKKSSDQA